MQGTLLSRFCSLTNQPHSQWTYCAINLPEDKKRETWGLNKIRSEKAFPQVQVNKLPDINSLDKERAGGRKCPAVPRTPSSWLDSMERGPPSLQKQSTLLHVWTPLYSQATDCVWTQTHNHMDWAPFKLKIASLKRGPSCRLAVPLSAPFPLPIPYTTISYTFPQTSHVTSFFLIFSLLLLL